METRILIVDDDPFICRQLEELYTSQRYAVACAGNSSEALRLLGEQDFALAVVDLKIPGTDGIGLTREIRDRWSELDVIMITGYASIKGAVEAIKQGASDYITKPFQKEEILLATEKILEKRRLLDEINYLRSQLSDRYSFANMVSRNRVMHEIFETISVLAQNDATVLIYGESGTGKELAARAVHFQGKRKNGRFVAINCAAFPDTLLESELFGYERGAFTGAIHDRVGKIELSNGGTLFLDEIESISLNMQLKLLRVLEEREIEKLGSNRRIKVNNRIITATNVDLAGLVAEGRMREDFYYRINVVPLRIPPLRERIEDIPLLVGEFLRNSEMAKDKGINRLSNRALSQLMSYQWPGNVRELGNVIERAILRTSGAVIREVDLPGHASVGRDAASAGNGRQAGYDFEVPLKEYLRRAEKDYLARVLRKYRGGINLSAKHALVDAATLHRKMKLHGLRREDYRNRGKADPDALGQ
jgi:DNA-binding NtrC family response regulator